MTSQARSVCAIGLAGLIAGTALGAIPFAKEALARGVDYMVSTGLPQFGCGVAFVDLDSDSDPDLITTGRTGGVVGLYENNGAGMFISRSTGSGLPVMTQPSGVSAADYDDDGDIDLLFTNWQQQGYLMRNNGNFTFTDVTAAAGMSLIGPQTGSAWGDYNGDGWLDVYVCVRTGSDGSAVQNRLYRNNGNGTFTDVAPALGVVDGVQPTLLCVWFDYDRDGDADLYLGTDKGSAGVWQNRFFRNDGGTFTDDTANAGLEAHVDCMGFAIGDLDHDGWQDIYMTNIPLGNPLMMADGDGTFTDHAAAAGMIAFEFDWATLFFDFDNDRWLDTFMVGEHFPKRLFHGGPTWPYEEIGFDVGFTDIDQSYCTATADIDHDGDMDLALSTFNKRIELYVNHEGSTRNWIRFNVVGRGHNRFGVGTQVDLRLGSDWQMREVFSGSNYKCQNEYTLHFGLGTSTKADEIVVSWPGGVTRTLTDYDANTTWSLYPPERLGDGDGDGDIDRSDITAAMQCYTGPGIGLVSPGCEVYDIDGDSDVDADDLAEMGLFTAPKVGHETPPRVRPIP